MLGHRTWWRGKVSLYSKYYNLNQWVDLPEVSFQFSKMEKTTIKPSNEESANHETHFNLYRKIKVQVLVAYTIR